MKQSSIRGKINRALKKHVLPELIGKTVKTRISYPGLPCNMKGKITSVGVSGFGDSTVQVTVDFPDGTEEMALEHLE